MQNLTDRFSKYWNVYELGITSVFVPFFEKTEFSIKCLLEGGACGEIKQISFRNFIIVVDVEHIRLKNAQSSYT